MLHYWLAGGGVKAGFSYGKTDDYSVNAVNPFTHDLQATILHLLGIDHEQLTYRYQGRYFRLTDVRQVVHDARPACSLQFNPPNLITYDENLPEIIPFALLVCPIFLSAAKPVSLQRERFDRMEGW